ncbi:MAG: SAM-dependent methyltransferase, partial [Chitinophagales bacterium]
MYSRLRLAQKYLHYYLKGSNGKGHGIHSPFVFDFIQSVLRDGHPYEPYTKVNGLRAQLLKNQKILSMEDFGAGSAFHSSSHRSIAEIARRASKSRKMGQLLFRVSHYYRPKIMIELGTSLGLSSAYLSLGNPDSKMITIEGSAEIAREAAGNFESLGLKNIKLINARFDDALAGIAARFQSQAANEKPDLGF